MQRGREYAQSVALLGCLNQQGCAEKQRLILRTLSPWLPIDRDVREQRGRLPTWAVCSPLTAASVVVLLAVEPMAMLPSHEISAV